MQADLRTGNNLCPKCLSAHPPTMDCTLPYFNADGVLTSPPMADLLTLAKEAETAPAERTRHLLEMGYEAIHGKLPQVDNWYGDVNASLRGDLFRRLLDINTQHAFLGAAMMLKPGGWTFEITLYPDGRGSIEAWHPERVHMIETLAATPALALLAAILRAEAAKMENSNA